MSRAAHWTGRAKPPDSFTVRAARLLLAVLALCLLAAASAQAAPRAPALSAPADGAGVQSPPALTWGSVKGAVQYQIEVAADPNFGSIVDNGRQRVRSTAASLDTTLADGEYFWRVRAIDDDRDAGKWSSVRSFVKTWTAQPQLLEPADALSVSWPTFPLILKWSNTEYAVKYMVTIATDPSLAQAIVGSVSKPLETSATVFALPATLPSGRYYWAVTPVDSAGHPGRRSRVGTFDWKWPNALTPTLEDLNPSTEPNPEGVVHHPLFKWTPVLGAARYDIEVNSSPDFAASSKKCCAESPTGTSISPTEQFENDREYYWRVRAVDPSGAAGTWYRGPDFTKGFDTATPSVKNLRLTDNLGTALAPGATTSAPVALWDPVPGAGAYEVQTADHDGVGACDWNNAHADHTATTAWTPIASTSADPDGSASWPPTTEDSNIVVNGSGPICLRVLAKLDDRAGDRQIISTWTQLGGEGNPAFVLQQPADYGTPVVPWQTSPGDYLSPSGITTQQMPVFRWKAVSGAKSYWVVVSRNSNFTSVIDVAFTRWPAYAPRHRDESKVYEDGTGLYWKVLPSQQTDGALSGTSQPVVFNKQSVPPEPIEPVDGSDVTRQVVFRWKPVHAAVSYTLQVATDESFSDVLETVKTESTVYATLKSYPADALLYWRVRANAEDGAALTWSYPREGYPLPTFRRRLPAPVPAADNPTGGEGIPPLRWGPLDGAVSYKVHVDYPDGDQKDFEIGSPAISFTKWAGPGVWRWRVAANYAAGSGTVSSAYSAPQDYVRRMGPPPGTRADANSQRVILAWQPDPVADRYLAEVSDTNSFTNNVERIRTENPVWAPTLNDNDYEAGGVFYWRVASIDDENNIGAFATGSFSFAKGMRLRLRGSQRRGRRDSTQVIVTDYRKKALRGVTVRLTGKGVRKLKRKTNKQGVAVFSMRPRKKGVLTFRATRKGYAPASTTLRVR